MIFSEEKAYKTFGISRVKKRKWEQWLLLIRMTSGGNDEEARCENGLPHSPHCCLMPMTMPPRGLALAIASCQLRWDGQAGLGL